MMFVSLIKESLKSVDEEYYNNLYGNHISKDFCFAVYLKNFEMKEDIFKIKDGITFNVSSPDYEFMINLYNGLLKLNNFQYKEFALEKERIDMVNEKKVYGEEVTFQTLSPIFIKDVYDNAVSIDNDNFVKELNYIANIILKNYRGYGLQEKLKFTSLNMEKRVVKQEFAESKEEIGTPYYVNSYMGTFRLEGKKEDLQDIYQLGIGFKRNQGFGMIEVV